ncbi:hypothetical protein [Streptomyces sp. NBC_00258]|uniref:hypothetical protein n=1 Tax=Streptomyces sp. NBC_00258 TaxID=2903642 RepID=UPI002E29CC60|nr:hypothetical protein [Streptomyces sp. NBC_00258]
MNAFSAWRHRSAASSVVRFGIALALAGAACFVTTPAHTASRAPDCAGKPLRTHPTELTDLRRGPGGHTGLITLMAANTMVTTEGCMVTGTRYQPMCGQVASYDGWREIRIDSDGLRGWTNEVCLFLR